MKVIYHIIGLVILSSLLLGLILFIVFIGQPERDAQLEENNLFCISKGYDNSPSFIIKEVNELKFIQCRKEVITIDDNGVAEFETISDTLVFKKGND